LNRILLTIFISLSFITCLRAQQKINYRKVPLVDSAVGFASFYSNSFIGKKTANGEIFSQSKMTCAHNTLPFGTQIRVTTLENEKFVVVRVNDRLHHRNSRLVDLTSSAAKELEFKGKGVIKVRVEVIRASESQISPPK
jgi:rare lipoprotein A